MGMKASYKLLKTYNRHKTTSVTRITYIVRKKTIKVLSL